ncbi:MAG: CRTAC1 family protein [Actinomycetota bacterium]
MNTRALAVAGTLLALACTATPATGPLGAARVPGEPLGFRDVATDVGLDFRQGAYRWDLSPDVGAMLGGGVCWLDFDDDGWMDLFVVNSYSRGDTTRWRAEGGLPRSALFHNGGGTFTDVSEGSGADVELRGNGCVAADLDMDGRTDLYVTGSERSVLLWNEGGGRFLDGTEAAGVEAFGWHTGTTAGDVNGDGWPDLFVAGYTDLNAPNPDATQGFPNTYGGVRDLLYVSSGRRDPGGRPTYREVGVDAGLEAVGFEYGLGATFSDLDSDGDLDLYVANDTKPNRLYDNVAWPGGAEADPAGLGFRFEELAGKAGVADPGAGMGVAVGDDGGDGFWDIFVANARGQSHALYRGQASELVNPSYVDVRYELGVDLEDATGWGVSWSDFDLDTDLDLLLVNGGIPVRDLTADAEPVLVLENLSAQGEDGYRDASAIADVDPIVGRGSATADFDNDGDLDVAVNTIGGTLLLLENTGTDGTWLKVALSRFAPGARITAELPDGRVLLREIAAGGSYLSTDDPRAAFGLGDATSVATLTVWWRGGRETVLHDVDVGQIVTVTE